MIDDFLRPPRTRLEWGADVVRVIGVLGIVVAFIWFAPTDAGVVAAALPAVFAPRFLGARAGFDLISGVVVLAAAWSNVFDLYRTVPGWDLVMHVVCTGVLAALLYLALARLEVVPAPAAVGALRRTPIVIVTALGLALGAIWEMIEWLGKEFVTDEIFVTYTDTIGDLAADGVGGLLAGILVAWVRLERRPRQRVQRAPQETSA
ncbi:hypothetical protein [Agromyces silvae]|uniref:hypothetical protein n=1 Tax=Agromyces silvae TaxID=3388266 RepID=UPI00280AE628|nr:hypothetical protein [Agromyces protaetiae]